MLRSIEKNTRGYRALVHQAYARKSLTRLVQESSAVGPYEDSLDLPGSSFLWIGDNHHLNRDEVEDLAVLLLHWLKNKQMPEGRPRSLPRPYAPQMPLFEPERGATRSSDPDTSREAVATIPAHKLSQMRRNILSLFEQYGAHTDPGLRASYEAQFPGTHAESTVRKRRGECVDMGWLEDSGKTRLHPGNSGVLQYTVWKITPSGINALRRSAD